MPELGVAKTVQAMYWRNKIAKGKESEKKQPISERVSLLRCPWIPESINLIETKPMKVTSFWTFIF